MRITVLAVLLVQFADGGDSRFLVLLPGEAFVTTITVGPEEPAQ